MAANNIQSASNEFNWQVNTRLDNVQVNHHGRVELPRQMSDVINQLLPNDLTATPQVIGVGGGNDHAVLEIDSYASPHETTHHHQMQMDESLEPVDTTPSESEEDDHNNNPNATDNAQQPTQNSRGLLSHFLEGDILLQIGFIVLLLARFIYEHRLGLLVYAALVGTFYQANCVVRTLVFERAAFKSMVPLVKRLWILLFPPINTALLLYMFDSQHLYSVLYFGLPDMGPTTLTVWNLLWIVVVGDMLVKYAVLEAKAVVALLPKRCISFKARGKFYIITEELSIFYRSLITIRPWCTYLLDSTQTGYVFTGILIVLYFLFKGFTMFRVGRRFARSVFKVWRDAGYGEQPSSDELRGAGEFCSICHSDFVNPIRLKCSHIFCEECVSIWFDRDQTCPMCRQKVTDKPMWRDGWTQLSVQWN